MFGEPDIEIAHTPDGLVVDIRGIDVYDPTTGAIRSDGPPSIALWMVDTAYNGESFPKPDTDRIAVKAINHYGDEVIKIYEV